MFEIYIIRGMPGSGKSTLAHKIAKDLGLNYKKNICEADQYFYRNGVYEFDQSKLYRAHKSCFDNFCNLIDSGKTAIVSNTFTRFNEFEPYIEKSEKSKANKIEIITCVDDFGSIHNVPEETLEKMKNRFVSAEEIADAYRYNTDIIHYEYSHIFSFKLI